MSDVRTLTILSIASYYKGGRFIETCKELGCHTILLTRDKLAEEAWPMQSIDERFLMTDLNLGPDLIHAVSYLARDRQIDRIVALDDFDVETVAHLREHLRIPGMGDSMARFFRDKLAMRMQARAHNVKVPEFVHVLNYDRLREFMGRVPLPWVLKPRSEAGSIGLKKIHHSEELWRTLDELGDRQSYFLLEQFIPGEVFHVDSIVVDGKVSFAAAHQYGRPPMSVMQEGGIFMTRTLPRGSSAEKAVLKMNRQVIAAMSLKNGVTHAEFIRGTEDGAYYFLEIAARVGGANIDRLVEAAAGINPWAEWARLLVAEANGETYVVPETRKDYAGIVTCLARQEWPDTSAYTDPEIIWRLQKKHHAGLLVGAADAGRVEELLWSYAGRFEQDFLAITPPPDSIRY